MCVIQPFTVPRHTFLRDVGFFTVAVTFTLAILWDSHIHGWEAAAMVGLYLVYVAIVAVGSWWEARSEKKQRRVRNARNEYAEEVDVGDVSPSAGRRAPQPQRYKDNREPLFTDYMNRSLGDAVLTSINAKHHHAQLLHH